MSDDFDFDSFLSDLKTDLDDASAAVPTPEPEPAQEPAPQTSQKTARTVSEDWPKVMDFEAAGVYYYKDALRSVGSKTKGFTLSDQEFLKKYVSGRKIYQMYFQDCIPALVPEPENPHDPNAIAVTLDGQKVGHVPADLCADVRRWMSGQYRIAVKAGGGPWKQSQEDYVEIGSPEYYVHVTVYAPVSSSAARYAAASRPSGRTTARTKTVCPKCGSSNISYQAVAEGRKTGCLTVLWYFFLFITILGWFILIPMLLRRKTKTVSYAVCQNCGYRWKK